MVAVLVAALFSVEALHWPFITLRQLAKCVATSALPFSKTNTLVCI